jgi:hypothetical protein
MGLGSVIFAIIGTEGTLNYVRCEPGIQFDAYSAETQLN